MRMRKKAWARPELAQCTYFTDEPEQFRGKWSERFGHDRPLWLDLGCGKCVFLGELARRHPEANIIGVDISYDILGVGRRKIEEIVENPDNVQLVFFHIEDLREMLSPEDKVQRIYLNFSNPWPKKKHNKRRLTYPDFLKMYGELLAEDGEIWFKTDNDELFEASIEYFNEAGYEIFTLTYDLHAENDPENIESEHEIMFTAEGIRTKALKARLKKQG
ncbi:MAG: tRNA (guanosine(46)-N7)-methyltransferase TrmB [Oscillospiraceae bacterium]|nr:tRNA (guanosine(46)-N7)-methyltransferase TrmB [Oscillospiraceae bacterium]